jgi:hypothetical protein
MELKDQLHFAFFVPGTGLEPVQRYRQGILSPLGTS